MIVCVDPGCTTGVARLRPDGTLVDYAQFQTEEELYGWLNMALHPECVLVYEAYVGAGPRDRYSVDTLLRIGGARALAVLRGTRVVAQQPQKRKAFRAQATDLVEHGTESGKNRHAADAVAHGLAYLHWGERQKRKKGKR